MSKTKELLILVAVICGAVTIATLAADYILSRKEYGEQYELTRESIASTGAFQTRDGRRWKVVPITDPRADWDSERAE